jgi:hypothetical protein
MPYFVKKPIPLEAHQVTPETAEDVAAWCGGEFVPATGAVEAHVIVHSLDGEGSRKALMGDWVFRGTRGEFWRVEESIFDETYGPAPADEAPSDEARIRDAMAEAQDHPGRTVTR